MKNNLGNKQTMAKNIKYYMDKNNVTAAEICKVLKVPQSTFSYWLSAKTYPRIDKIEMMANYFGVNKSNLVEEHVKLSNIIDVPTMRRVPLIGSIACGEPITAVENAEGVVDIPENIHADFALRCKGDSMINARIFDGDIVYIHAQPTVDSGQIAAVYVDGIEREATLKRIYIYDDHIVLAPENPLYKPFVYWGDEIQKVSIIGVAIAFTSVIR